MAESAMIGDGGGAGIFAHRLGELEAVHVRHFDIGDDDVEPRAGLERRERLRAEATATT
jgi:hypothetical protein